MGKRLKQQRRGKGTPRYKAPSHRYFTDVKLPKLTELFKSSYVVGEVEGFVDDPGRNTLVAVVRLENGERLPLLAAEGMYVGQKVFLGHEAPFSIGGVVELEKVPEGFYVYNIEKTPGDGGKFVRSGGSYAVVVSKDENFVYVKLPSRKIVAFNPKNRAQIGVVAGGGIKELPLIKAGNAYYKFKARNRLWPVVRGVAMSPYNHPFGGKQHHPGRPTTVKREAPPGQKVGHIAARKTGRGGKR